MENISIKTIQSQVYEIIKGNISAGVYRPNQRLQEIEIANELSVSRSPVREAFRELTAEGLLVALPNKGVYVKEFSQKDFREIFELRMLMENYAIRKMTPETVDKLRENFDKVCKKMKYALDTHDIPLYINADTELHQMLVSSSGNELLFSTYRRTITMVGHSISNALRAPERMAGSDVEHMEIVSLLMQYEFEKAAQANEVHLERTYQALITEIFYRNT